MLISPLLNHSPHPRSKKPSHGKRILSFFLFVFIGSALVGSFYLIHLYQTLSQGLPEAKDIVITREESSSVYDREGNILTVLYLSEQRLYVSLKDVSEPVKKSIVASEDERFFLHEGVDFKAVLRAIYINLLQGDLSQGGSTITQQLARNIFLNQEKTYVRKVKEIILSMRIEQVFKKTEILEMYINQCYFGEGCYGIETASRKYFNKHASELDLSEATLLVAVLPSPSTLNLYDSFEEVKKKQKVVLDKMVENKFITAPESQIAYAKIVTVFEGDSLSNNDSEHPFGLDYFIDYIEEQVIDQLSADELYRGGLHIYTTISQPVQEACFISMKEVLEDGEKKGVLPQNTKDSLGVIQPQGAVVSLDPKTGEILAMVGGRDYQNTRFNRTLASRQPGSSFKVFPYTAAIDSGIISPETRETSNYINIDGWRPQEWSGSYFGSMTIQRAIQISSNIVAVKVAMKMGLEKVVEYAHQMGITTELLPVPSLALGSLDVRPLDMASAFGTISNEGKHIKPFSISRIEKPGIQEAIYANAPSFYQAISPQAAWLMTQLLQTPLAPGGTASSVNVPGIFVAGKTGTTENYKDGWFVGFTKGVSIAVYIGSDSKEVDLSYIRNYGSEFAGKIFKTIVQKIYQPSFPLRFVNENWRKPEGILSVPICNETGFKANETCPYHMETRIAGFVPAFCGKIHKLPVDETKKEEEKEKQEKLDKDKESTPENNPDPPPPEIDSSDPSEQKENPPPKPKSSFQKPFISDTGDFSLSFSTQMVAMGSPTQIDFSVWDPVATSIELYVDGSLVAVLNQAPYRYYYSPLSPGEIVFQAVLRDTEKNIRGNKIIPVYIYPHSS